MALPSTSTPQRSEPGSIGELAARCRALAGQRVEDLARELAYALPARPSQRKGKVGVLLERALGARASSASRPDFGELGVELKTLPVAPDGRPLESTFVCSFSLAEAERAEWPSSAVRAKLAHVLFVPVVQGAGEPRIGTAFFWRPSPDEESLLRADFEELAGLIALGHVETLDARRGAWLQLRPKAAHGGVKIYVRNGDGEPVATAPRGFYLRARVTAWLLRRALASDGAESGSVRVAR